MSAKKNLIIFVVLVLVAAGVLVGTLLGRRQGEVEGASRVREELQPLIDRAFPPPPPEITSFGGTIREIYGAKITLEIVDPDDYLPHTDGTPQKKETRYVLVSTATKITLVDYTKRDAAGVSPLVKSLNFSDLKVGDIVNVRSSKNIRDLQEFDASEIKVIKY